MVNRFVLNEMSYHGKGARSVLSTEIINRGFKKVLVVTDKALYEAGVTAKVLDVLNNTGIEYEVYSDVKPNPTVTNVLNGLKICKEFGADVLVAVGGGSSIDTAKAIGIIATNEEFSDVVSLEGAADTKNKALPIIHLVLLLRLQ